MRTGLVQSLCIGSFADVKLIVRCAIQVYSPSRGVVADVVHPSGGKASSIGLSGSVVAFLYMNCIYDPFCPFVALMSNVSMINLSNV